MFSEIFYRGNQDWKAYINNEYVDHFRVDYAFRGLVVPAGNHQIEFRFEPKTYYTARKISMASSTIGLLLLLGLFFFHFKEEGWFSKAETKSKKK